MDVVSRRWVWLETMGMISGCGCKEIYRLPHISHSFSSCICSFCSSIPTFCSFLKRFSFLLLIRLIPKKFEPIFTPSILTFNSYL